MCQIIYMLTDLAEFKTSPGIYLLIQNVYVFVFAEANRTQVATKFLALAGDGLCASVWF